jgi:hypothetical protein
VLPRAAAYPVAGAAPGKALPAREGARRCQCPHQDADSGGVPGRPEALPSALLRMASCVAPELASIVRGTVRRSTGVLVSLTPVEYEHVRRTAQLAGLANSHESVQQFPPVPLATVSP